MITFTPWFAATGPSDGLWSLTSSQLLCRWAQAQLLAGHEAHKFCKKVSINDDFFVVSTDLLFE